MNWIRVAVVLAAMVLGQMSAPFSPPVMSGTTVNIGGSLLVAGGAATGTATVSGAVAGTPCVAMASDGSLPAAGSVVTCGGTAANTVTVSVTAIIAVTPAGKTYNVRVFP